MRFTSMTTRKKLFALALAGFVAGTIGCGEAGRDSDEEFRNEDEIEGSSEVVSPSDEENDALDQAEDSGESVSLSDEENDALDQAEDSGESVSLSDEEYDDIAKSVAPLIRAEFREGGTVDRSAKMALGFIPFWFRYQADGSVQGTMGGLTWDLSRRCISEDNIELDLCDENTDQVLVSNTINGDLTLPGYQAALELGADLSVSGLQSDIVVVTGDSHVLAESEFIPFFDPTPRTMKLDMNSSYELQSAPDSLCIFEGSVEATIDAQRSAWPRIDSFVNLTAVVEGTDNACSVTVVLDGHAQYEINLVTGFIFRI